MFTPFRLSASANLTTSRGKNQRGETERATCGNRGGSAILNALQSHCGKTMDKTKSNQAGWQSDVALIALALMWGTSHVITKEILATHSPAFYTSLRFGIAAVCFGLAFAGHLRRSNRREIKQGVLLGLLSFAGIGLYVVGLSFTQVSNA